MFVQLLCKYCSETIVILHYVHKGASSDFKILQHG